MTARSVSTTNLHSCGVDFTANFHCIWTTSTERTTTWWIHRAWQITLKKNPLTASFPIRIRYRNRAEQSLSIRMGWVIKQLFFCTCLNNLAQVHDRDAI